MKVRDIRTFNMFIGCSKSNWQPCEYCKMDDCCIPQADIARSAQLEARARDAYKNKRILQLLEMGFTPGEIKRMVGTSHEYVKRMKKHIAKSVLT